MTSTPAQGGSLGSAFAKMFSGTLVSRLLGMVRLIVLGAALGEMGQADAFNVANTLPNNIYNLLAGGILNAVLVPQIVRAMRREDGGAAYTNKLITLAGTILFGATIVFTVAAPLLVMVFSGAMDPQWRDVAVILALWCIPEVLFYGLYAIFGNILNARGSFGPYMWAPVMNNVVAILGLFVYMWVYGSAASGSGSDPASWDAARTALVGGFALLGVAAQALVLIPALVRSGVRYRPDFAFRGAGLSAASNMATWTFIGLLIGQIGVLAVYNVAGAANGAATELRAAGDAAYVLIPTTTAYTMTFAVFMLPQSLVTTSLVTAVFTSMSKKAAAGDRDGVRDDMSHSMRTLGVFTVFAGAAMMVLALPIVQTILFTISSASAPAFAAVLAALGFGIPAQSVWTIVQRVSFSYEDAKTLAKIQVPMSALIAVIGVLAVFLLPARWWVVAAAVGMSLSNYLGGVIGYLSLRTKIRSLDGSRILRTYFRLTLAVIPAALIGWGLLHLWGPFTGGSGASQTLGALLKAVVVGGIMLAIYLFLLRRLGVTELDSLLSPLRRLGAKLTRRGGAAGVAAASTMEAPGHGPSDPTPRRDVEGAHVDPQPQQGNLAERFHLDSKVSTLPTGAETWHGQDLVLARPVTVVAMTNDQSGTLAPAFLDAARRASLVEDNRFARLVDIGEVEVGGEPWAYVVSENPPGQPLASFAGQFGPDEARAVVGETAAALEAARRRGVQHGALTADNVYLHDAGVTITGLAYLTVASGTAPETTDAVEASLERARRDADALAEIHSLLTGGQPLPGEGNHENAGSVMRTLAPWGALPTGPSGAVAAAVAAGGTVLAAGVGGAAGAARETEAEAATGTIPPPPPPPERTLDPSTWTLHPGDLSAGSDAPFEDVITVSEEPTEREGPTHVGADLPAWRVLLPSTEDVAGRDEPPTDAPASDAQPSDSSTADGTSSDGDRPRGPRAAASGVAAAATGVAAGASTKLRDVAGKIDSFVQHDMRVPGELPEEENTNLPISERRVDPGPFVLVLIALLVAIGTIFAFLNLASIQMPVPRSAGGPVITGEQRPEPPPPAEEPPAEEAPAEEPAEPVVVTPVISMIDVLDPPPNGDGQENPELTPRAFDGDPGTYWRSRSYVNPTYGMKSGIGLDVQFAETSTVTEIVIHLHGEGGHVQVLADPATVNDPEREVIAEVDMARDTVITLPEPREMDRVVLWFTALPVADSDGKNRVELTELEVN